MIIRKQLSVALATAALATGLVTAAAPASAKPARVAAAECGVRADGKLWCGNRVGAKGYAHRSFSSAVRGPLNSSFSWFACWGPGDPHGGGNNVWYWTQLDNGQWGNVPASDVHTSVDPAPGLRQC